MRIRHVNSGQDLVLEDYTNYWGLLERPFKCTCFCLARPEMTAKLGTGQIGKVTEPFTCCDPMFHVKDNKEQVRWKITADCYQCGLLCRQGCGKCSEVTFPIYSADKQELNENNRDGFIKKLFGGVAELVTDADSFLLEFPLNATPEEKLLLISTVLMIDFRFFEDSPGQGSQ